MNDISRILLPCSRSDSRKSKTCTQLSRGSFLPTIENPKSKIQNAMAGLFAIVVALTLCGARAEAQQPRKIPLIGYLLPGNPTRESTDAEGLRLALRELGYIEGQSIAIEYRYAEGKRDRFPELAAQLVRLKVDIIVVAGGNTPVRDVKNATKTIPIVMAGWVRSRRGRTD